MKPARERILVVENDPNLSDLVARQTLQAAGYQVEVVRSAAPVIQGLNHFNPDVIVCDLSLPGLSGKDLLVALKAQGVETPVVLLAQKGLEAEVIQGFRLGAADYLLWPCREAEILAAVERVLKQGSLHRERQAGELQQANDELQRRVRELTTLFALGKALTAIADPRLLYEKLVEGAVYIAEAQSGWLLVHEDGYRNFWLRAQRGLPPALAARLNQPWDDGISSLASLAGESLAFHGQPPGGFPAAQVGQAALAVPLKVKKVVAGVIVVARKAPQPFNPAHKRLLEAAADYASIALVNARRLQASEQRLHSLEEAAGQAHDREREQAAAQAQLYRRLSAPLQGAFRSLQALRGGANTCLEPSQQAALRSLADQLQALAAVVDPLAPRSPDS